MYTVPAQKCLRCQEKSGSEFELLTSTARRLPSPSPTIAHPARPSRGMVRPLSKRNKALERDVDGDPKRYIAVWDGRQTSGRALDMMTLPMKTPKSSSRYSEKLGQLSHEHDSRKWAPISPTQIYHSNLARLPVPDVTSHRETRCDG